MEFNVEYSPQHELAAEKSVVKPAGFEITSESIRTVQNVCILFIKRFFFHIYHEIFLIENNNH